VDGVVEEAVPLEQAGRALVHWWHLRFFRHAMEGKALVKQREERGEEEAGEAAKGKEEGEEEYNFFARELEKMGWGVGGVLGDEDEAAVGGEAVGNEFEGGPLEREGWA